MSQVYPLPSVDFLISGCQLMCWIMYVWHPPTSTRIRKTSTCIRNMPTSILHWQYGIKGHPFSPRLNGKFMIKYELQFLFGQQQRYLSHAFLLFTCKQMQVYTKVEIGITSSPGISTNGVSQPSQDTIGGHGGKCINVMLYGMVWKEGQPSRWVESISSPIPINLGISSSQHTPSFPETCPRHYVLYPRDSSLPYWHVHISLWLASIS